MSSEIEIVAEGETPRGNGTEVGKTRLEEEEPIKDDVYTAAAHGDVEKLRRLVEEEKCSVSQPDSSGYYALQWSALNNRSAAAQYLLEVSFFAHLLPTLIFLHQLLTCTRGLRAYLYSSILLLEMSLHLSFY